MLRFILLLLGIYNVVLTVTGQCYEPCPNGWFTYKGSCYYLGYEQSMSFVESAHYCQRNNAHLITIETGLENSFIQDLLNMTKLDHVWIGLSDGASEGVWRWDSNNQVTQFTDWAPGQPETGKNEDCAGYHVTSHYQWQDYQCTSKMHPLCEKSFETAIEVIG